MVRLVFICVFLCLLFGSELKGAEPIEIKNISQKIHLEKIDQYIDTLSTLSFEQFQSNRELFYTTGYELQGTRNRAYTYWMTFTLTGELLKEEEFYLICSDNRISLMELYIDGKVQTDGPVGNDFLFSNRNISHRSFVFSLPLKEEIEVIVKIKANQSTFFSFTVKTENQFLGDSFFESGLRGSIYGMIMLAIFFSLFMSLKFKESVYISYPVFATVSLVIFLFLDGAGFQYIWGEMPLVNLYLLLFLPIALMLSLGAVVISVLDAWDKNNRFFKIILGSILVSQLGYVFAFTIPQYFIHNVLYIVPFIAMLYACIVKYRTGVKSILAFIIGLVFVVLANSIYVFHPFFALDYSNYFVQYSSHFGVIALTISMTYSQFVNFYNIRESRRSERQKSIKHLERLNQIKDRINEEIAEKVAQQTKELERRNVVIHVRNAELHDANYKLKEQTDEIVNLNLQLNKENQELKSDVKKITASHIFQSTIPFDDFKKFFNSDDSCFALLEDLKWQAGFECLKCGNSKYGAGKGSRARRCTKCGTNESVTSNTIFHRIHFPILKGIYILFLVNKHGDNLVSKELSQIVDLRLATCWKLSKKIKQKKFEMEQSGKIIESWLDLI